MNSYWRSLCIVVLTFSLCPIAISQSVSELKISLEFFPDDAQMYGFRVSSESFFRGNSRVVFSEVNDDTLTFYLHGELKIDSIISRGKTLDYGSQKIFYPNDYSNVGLKTKVPTSQLEGGKELSIYYSGFFSSSRARSLSDYMRISERDGIFLRGYYYSLWFPVFLKPEQEEYPINITELKIKAPKNITAISVGERLDVNIKGDQEEVVWSPGRVLPSDLQITGRPYKKFKSQNVFVYYVGESDKGRKIASFVESLNNVFKSYFLDAQTSDTLFILELPEYGNISSLNVIGISEDVYENFESDLYSRRTIAHELVHPYVQMQISSTNEFYALVIEGFANFFHLYAMQKIDDESLDLYLFMKKVERTYLQMKETGKDWRGNPLPNEIPILKIEADEIGVYKDRFILSDRVRLFLYTLLVKMGEEKFDLFIKDLFSSSYLDYRSFESLVVNYLPGYENELDIWLNSIDYPDEFLLD